LKQISLARTPIFPDNAERGSETLCARSGIPGRQSCGGEAEGLVFPSPHPHFTHEKWPASDNHGQKCNSSAHFEGAERRQNWSCQWVGAAVTLGAMPKEHAMLKQSENPPGLIRRTKTHPMRSTAVHYWTRMPAHSIRRVMRISLENRSARPWAHCDDHQLGQNEPMIGSNSDLSLA
jgi:hypothetical protein